MNGIACPVGHVVEKLIVFDHDERVLLRTVHAIPEVRIFYVDYPACGPNVLTKHVINEKYSTSVALYHKRRYCFN